MFTFVLRTEKYPAKNIHSVLVPRINLLQTINSFERCDLHISCIAKKIDAFIVITLIDHGYFTTTA